MISRISQLVFRGNIKSGDGSGLRLGSPPPGMLRLPTAFKATKLTHAHFRVFKCVSTERTVNQGLNHKLFLQNKRFYQVCLQSGMIMTVSMPERWLLLWLLQRRHSSPILHLPHHLAASEQWDYGLTYLPSLPILMHSRQFDTTDISVSKIAFRSKRSGFGPAPLTFPSFTCIHITHARNVTMSCNRKKRERPLLLSSS